MTMTLPTARPRVRERRVQTGICLTQEEYNRLAEAAGGLGVSMSEVGRRAILPYLERLEQEREDQG